MLWIPEVSLRGWIHSQSSVQPGEHLRGKQRAVEQGGQACYRALAVGQGLFSCDDNNLTCQGAGNTSVERCQETRGLTRISLRSGGVLIWRCSHCLQNICGMTPSHN